MDTTAGASLWRVSCQKVAEACGVEHPSLITGDMVEILLGTYSATPLWQSVGYDDPGWGLPSPEQQEQMQGFIEELRKDPQAAILKLVGQPDLTGVQTALLSLASVSDPQAVTEQPEDVPFDAAVVQTITVKREDLTKLTSELGKVLYAMPVVRQFGGSDLTEEKLIEKLNSIPEGLAEDVEVRLYTAESGVTMIAVTELKIKNGEKVQPLKLSVLIDMIEDGMRAVVIAEADQGLVVISYSDLAEADLPGLVARLEELVAG